jgi:AbrB family looped-hinge helix DNA binding protein
MKTAIDRAGRLVIPRQLRQAAGIRPGEAVDLLAKDGAIIIRPAETEMRLEKQGRFMVIVPEVPIEPLGEEIVTKTLEEIRERRLADETKP